MEENERQRGFETALITGGGRGLGRALAKGLAARGARVVITSRTESELRAVVEEIARAGGEAHYVVGDVADKAAIHRIAGAAAALVGPIDLLVQNASALGPTPMPYLLDTECEDFGAVLEANVVGPFRLAKVIGGSMALRKRGTIVFVSSDAATNAYPRWGAYGISKAASDHLARSLAAELPDLRVVAADPGEMNTAMHRSAVPDADPTTLLAPEDVAAAFLRMLDDRGAKSGDRVELATWRAA